MSRGRSRLLVRLGQWYEEGRVTGWLRLSDWRNSAGRGVNFRKAMNFRQVIGGISPDYELNCDWINPLNCRD